MFPDGAAGGFAGRAVFPASAAAGLKDVEGVRVVTQGITLLFEKEMPMVTFGMPDMISGININEQIEVAKYNPDLRLNVYRGDWWEEGNTGVAVLGINLATKQKVSVGDVITHGLLILTWSPIISSQPGINTYREI